MNRHVVLTDDTVDDAALLAALEAAGIEAQAKPLHLQRAARVAADIVCEYPVGERGRARDKLVAWLDKAMDAYDYERSVRITDSIERLRIEHGELATWRCPGGYIALDVPTAFVTSISRAQGAKRDIELRTLTGLMLPQLERIAPNLMQHALGSEYAGNRGDYQRLVALACRELLTK